MLPGNIAYVALNGFDDDTSVKEWDKHWGEISKATSLMPDLRENGGGSDSVGTHEMATLIDKWVHTPLSRSTRRIAICSVWGDAETPLRFPISKIAPDTARHFAGPVVMFTSARTFSAGEDMAAVFAQAHRGKVIGEPTGGSSVQRLLLKLSGVGAARLCMKHAKFADGREFVDVGKPPDMPVRETRADIMAGQDRVLKAAVRSLEKIR